MREIKLPGGVTLFQQQAESDSELSRDPLSGNSQPHKHQQTEQTAQQWYEMSGVTRRCRDHAECRAYRTHIFVSGPATDRIKRPCVSLVICLLTHPKHFNPRCGVPHQPWRHPDTIPTVGGDPSLSVSLQAGYRSCKALVVVTWTSSPSGLYSGTVSSNAVLQFQQKPEPS